MKAAVIYCRVSTSQQAIDGVSLDAQQERLKSWAAAHGSEVLGVHVDAGLSGKRADNRPALQDALDQACQEQAILVVYSLSRLARSTKDAIGIAERLSKAGADLVSLSEEINTTSAAGKMIFRLLAVLAEFERDVIAERTRFALRHKMAKGEKVGGRVPYGFRAKGGKLIAEPREQEGIRWGLELRKKGLSLRAVAQLLHRDGFTKGLMDAKTVARILSRQREKVRG